MEKNQKQQCVDCGKEHSSVATTPQDPEPKCFGCRMARAQVKLREVLQNARLARKATT